MFNYSDFQLINIKTNLNNKIIKNKKFLKQITNFLNNKLYKK